MQKRSPYVRLRLRAKQTNRVDIICHKGSNHAMTTITDPFIWIALAVLLALAEIIVPGGVVFFLGASSAIVAISLWLGFVTTWVNALSLFFISSLVLIVSFRAVVSRFAEAIHIWRIQKKF